MAKINKYQDYETLPALKYIKKYPQLLTGLRYVIGIEKVRIHKEDCEVFQQRFIDIINLELKDIINRPIIQE